MRNWTRFTNCYRPYNIPLSRIIYTQLLFKLRHSCRTSSLERCPVIVWTIRSNAKNITTDKIIYVYNNHLFILLHSDVVSLTCARGKYLFSPPPIRKPYNMFSNFLFCRPFGAHLWVEPGAWCPPKKNGINHTDVCRDLDACAVLCFWPHTVVNVTGDRRVWGVYLFIY